jgi:hypothetical protein
MAFYSASKFGASLHRSSATLSNLANSSGRIFRVTFKGTAHRVEHQSNDVSKSCAVDLQSCFILWTALNLEACVLSGTRAT